jgi:DNA (cytosine-5)-methyltransferase 1
VDNTEELPTVLSFCSGYGGIERGLDLIGVKHRVIAYVEIEAYAIANLVAKMESGELDAAPIYTDLKTFPSEVFRDRVDLITGGYPCQPFSAAGMRKGEEDERHLWPHIRRHIQTIRPTQCFFENVQGHITLGLSTVISDMGEDGYRATWGIFSASEVGASHERKRVFILADSTSRRLKKYGYSKSDDAIKASKIVADPMREGLARRWRYESGAREKFAEHILHGQTFPGGRGSKPYDWESTRLKPRLGRADDGFANKADRLRLLGNGVVPQTAAKAWYILNDRNLGE